MTETAYFAVEVNLRRVKHELANLIKNYDIMFEAERLARRESNQSENEGNLDFPMSECQ